VSGAQKPATLPQPWAGLPPEVAAVLRPGVPQASVEIVDAIRAGVPAYARGVESALAANVQVAGRDVLSWLVGLVEQTLTQFLDLVENPGRGRSGERETYVRLGRGQARAGQPMEALLAAYRIGARVVWRRVAEFARAAGLGEEILARLAESIFAYIDELSAASAEGYAQEQAAAAGEAERRSRHLVSLMIQSPPADEATVEDAAREAGWRLPASLAALIWRQSEEGIAGRLGAESVAAPLEDFCCSFVPDPAAPGRRAEVERALRGHEAVIGPTVPWQRAAVSARRAIAVHRLLHEGAIAANGLVVANEHLTTLILNSNRALLDDLAQQRLAPLADETEGSRERLSQTLLAWLDHQGNVAEIADTLHVHPQTVRYRLGRLRDCFGVTLDDPQGRFELELVLRARSQA
jgi:hypothetical protein